MVTVICTAKGNPMSAYNLDGECNKFFLDRIYYEFSSRQMRAKMYFSIEFRGVKHHPQIFFGQMYPVQGSHCKKWQVSTTSLQHPLSPLIYIVNLTNKLQAAPLAGCKLYKTLTIIAADMSLADCIVHNLHLMSPPCRWDVVCQL